MDKIYPLNSNYSFQKGNSSLFLIDKPWSLAKFRLFQTMDKKRPFSLQSPSLSVWLVAGVGAFVLLGSVALMVFFQHLTRLEEENSLESLGRNNALFLDQARLPQSEQMAERMGRVMGARVEFRDAEGSVVYGKVRRLGDEMRVGYALRNGREVWFTRDIRHAGARPFWKRWDAWVILAGFWLLALVFSLWLGRRVTRPLGKLAAMLPGMGGDKALEGLPVDGPSEIVALATALRDTQASILSEREKRRQVERLALLGKMAASLAHEVRNPVSAIQLHAQLLERAVSPADRTSAEMIVAEAGRIESLVSQWLGYAKPGSMAVAPVDIAALVREITRTFEPRASHANVQIRVDIDPDASTTRVTGDADRLRQVFGNLVLNAIQSMPKGGTAQVRVMADCVEVSDDGPGFSMMALEKFGEPFHSEREGGMGLGLAVSKEIVEAHGALLEAENRPEGGALVRIRWAASGIRKTS